jgi:hypothetical protein
MAELFSRVLKNWLTKSKKTTLAEMAEVFGEKAFAIIFLLLMALPALPLPTGGVTHITELITMLVCLQLIAGRSTIWLPKRWKEIDVKKHLSGKAADKLIGIIKWFERFSRKRMRVMVSQKPWISLTGIFVLVFTLAAFVAPPFSGLDTLPALGVVVISLSMILEDGVIMLAGIALGGVGIGLEIAAGTALYKGILHFL